MRTRIVNAEQYAAGYQVFLGPWFVPNVSVRPFTFVRNVDGGAIEVVEPEDEIAYEHAQRRARGEVP